LQFQKEKATAGIYGGSLGHGLPPLRELSDFKGQELVAEA